MLRSVAPPPIAFDDAATYLVTSDKNLVLVHDGDTEAPLFVHPMDADVVALACSATEVTAIDADGTGVVLDRAGTVIRTITTGASARGGAAARGRIAVFGTAVTLVSTGGDRYGLAIAHASCAAFSDGGTLLVGTEQNELVAINASTGTILVRTTLPNVIRGIAWNMQGYFVVTTAGGLGRVVDEYSRIIPLCGTGEVKLDAVACSTDGKFAACRVEDGRVIIFEIAKNRPVGIITWERATGALAFGPDCVLAVALDQGDGNKLDLATGAVSRTDPHPGRPRNRWLVLPELKTDRIAEVRGPKSKRMMRLAAKTSAPTPHRHENDATEEQSPPARNTLPIVVAAIAFAIVLFGVAILASH